LGIPRGHALKLKRHLREYQIDACAEGQAQAIAMKPVAAVPCSTRASHKPPRPPSKVADQQLNATETMKGDVERSWDVIQEMGTDAVGERIYRVFFDLVPEAMDSFPVEVRAKYREWTADENEEEGDLINSAALRKLFAKVLNALGCVVAGLQDSSKLVPLLTSLGRRHIGYRVVEAFWPQLGKAINLTLADLLGDGFTSEVENAWNVVYGFASSIMIAGLREAKQAALQLKACDERSECARSQRSCASHQSRTTELTTSECSESESGFASESWCRAAGA